MDGRRLARKAERVERSIEPVAAAVAGKDSSRAIAAVRRRRQADDEQTRRRIAESRQRLGPVALPLIAEWRFFGDLLAPTDQARALSASDHSPTEMIQLSHEGFCYHNDEKERS